MKSVLGYDLSSMHKNLTKLPSLKLPYIIPLHRSIMICSICKMAKQSKEMKKMKARYWVMSIIKIC